MSGKKKGFDVNATVYATVYDAGDIEQQHGGSDFYLLVINGENAGTSYPLTGETTLIGRQEDCDIILPDQRISRKHTSIIRTPGNDGVLVRDLGSHNGTLVNGSPIDIPTRITPGDMLSIGGTLLRLVIKSRSEIEFEETQKSKQAAMEISLKTASRRQKNMLPDIPDAPGLELDAIFHPCEGISGDFYDFIPLPNDRLGIIIGDVTGHGVEAGLLMSMAKKAIHLHGRENNDPAKTLVLANNDIVQDVEFGDFITAFYAIIDPHNMTLTCANAGHNPPLLINSEREETVSEISITGASLGLLKENKFAAIVKPHTIPLQKNDCLLLYTDGIPEAINNEKEEYTSERFKESAARNADKRPRHLLNTIIDDMREYCGTSNQTDDVTAVCIRILGL